MDAKWKWLVGGLVLGSVFSFLSALVLASRMNLDTLHASQQAREICESVIYNGYERKEVRRQFEARRFKVTESGDETSAEYVISEGPFTLMPVSVYAHVRFEGERPVAHMVIVLGAPL